MQETVGSSPTSPMQDQQKANLGGGAADAEASTVV